MRDRGNGKSFGCAVGSVDFCIFWKVCKKGAQNFRGYRRTCGQHPFQGFELSLGKIAARSHTLEQRRGSEHVGNAVLTNRADNVGRLHAARAGEIHFRNDGSNPHSRIEERKQGKCRQADLTFHDAVMLLKEFHLSVQKALGIDGPFGRAGAARSENYSRRLVRIHGNGFERRLIVSRGPQAGVSGTAPNPGSAHADFHADGFFPPAKEQPPPMRSRDADENLRPRRFQAAADLAQADPRIDENRDRAQFEEREGQDKEFPRRRHEEGHARGFLHSGQRKTPSQNAAFPFELAVRNALAGKDIGGAVGKLISPPLEMESKIGET